MGGISFGAKTCRQDQPPTVSSRSGDGRWGNALPGSGWSLVYPNRRAHADDDLGEEGSRLRVLDDLCLDDTLADVLVKGQVGQPLLVDCPRDLPGGGLWGEERGLGGETRW